MGNLFSKSTSSAAGDDVDVKYGGCSSDGRLQPRQLSVVVRRILQFLPIPDVKKARLLSRLWNEEALLVLRDRVTVGFLRNGPFLDSNDYLEQIVVFAKSRMNEMQFPKWRVRLPIIDEPQPGLQRIKEERILQDLNWFLSPPHHHNATSLHLTGSLGSDASLEVLKNLLSGLKETLSSLTLKLRLKDGFNPPEDFRFEEMTALVSLSFSMGGNQGVQSSCYRFIKALMPAFKHIQSFTLDNFKLFHSSSPSFAFSTKVLETVIVEEGFSSMTELIITGLLDSHVPHLASHFTIGRLTKLDLGNLIRESWTARPVVTILSAHASTLISLKLQTYICDRERLTLSLPERMEALESLTMFPSFVSKWVGENLEVGFDFGNAEEELDYSHRFPSLKKLVVWPVVGRAKLPFIKDKGCSWFNFRPVLVAFLRRSETLTEVDIPFLLDGKYEGMLNGLEDKFPNVTFPPELEAARKGPMYDEEDQWLELDC